MSPQPWLTITSGASGTGSAPVSYTAAPNADAGPRARATVTVNGAVYTVTQFGTGCSFAITPASLSATAAGGTATVSIAASSAAVRLDGVSGAGLASSPGAAPGAASVTRDRAAESGRRPRASYGDHRGSAVLGDADGHRLHSSP